MLTVLREPAVLRLVRGVLTGVAVGFDTLEAATNNPVVTENVACVADFPCGPVVSISLRCFPMPSLPCCHRLRSLQKS